MFEKEVKAGSVENLQDILYLHEGNHKLVVDGGNLAIYLGDLAIPIVPDIIQKYTGWNPFKLKPVRWWELATLLLIKNFDSWGTAVGFQGPAWMPLSEENIDTIPIKGPLKEKIKGWWLANGKKIAVAEANLGGQELIKMLIKNGFADTESQALVRWSTFQDILIILYWWKFGISGNAKAVMLGAYGYLHGYMGGLLWWRGNEDKTEWLTALKYLFVDGKKTPWVVDITIPNPK